MDHENWYRVDNVSKVFLATHNDRDTRTLRVSCTLKEKINPDILSEALKKSVRPGNILQVRIRRGVFWNYIEPTDAIPEVSEEHERPCPVLYGKNHRGILHYSVTYFNRRINLEIFHALTDGTGALEFLNTLVINYLKLIYPEELAELSAGSGTAESELEQDSFDKFYEKEPDSNISGAGKAYHIRGIRLPYDQLQFFRVAVPSDSLKKLAKENGAGITSFISARLMMAIYRDMPAVKRHLPVTVSVPVNLRNYYDSETGRNFFNSVSVPHVFNGKETVSELALKFDRSLKESLQPENIRHQMNHYQRIERIMALRMVPLFLKQPVIKFFARKEAKNVSAVVSNLGIIKVPDRIKKYIDEYAVLCSHSDFYMSLATFGEKTVMGITSGIRNTNVIRNFISGLAKDGLETELDATEVVR